MEIFRSSQAGGTSFLPPHVPPLVPRRLFKFLHQFVQSGSLRVSGFWFLFISSVVDYIVRLSGKFYSWLTHYLVFSVYVLIQSMTIHKLNVLVSVTVCVTHLRSLVATSLWSSTKQKADPADTRGEYVAEKQTPDQEASTVASNVLTQHLN